MQFRSTKSSDDAERASSTLRAFAQLELIANAETAPSLDDLARASGVAPAPARTLFGTRPHKRCTERTITDLQTLERELLKVRSSGIATDVGEYFVGSVCLAVPISDPRGRGGAIAIHGPAPRMTLKNGIDFLPALKRTAASISAMLARAGNAAHPKPVSRLAVAAPLRGASDVRARQHHRGDCRRSAEDGGQSTRVHDPSGADRIHAQGVRGPLAARIAQTYRTFSQPATGGDLGDLTKSRTMSTCNE